MTREKDVAWMTQQCDLCGSDLARVRIFMIDIGRVMRARPVPCCIKCALQIWEEAELPLS